MKLTIMLLTILLYSGCSNCPQVERNENTIVKIDTVRVFLPADVQFDTVFISNEQTGENERYIVRVDTHRVYIKGKERVIYVPIKDTVKVVEYKTIQEKGFFDGITLKQIIIGAFIFIVIGFVIFILRQFGVFSR